MERTKWYYIRRLILSVFIFAGIWFNLFSQNVITVSDKIFLINNKPFEFTGLSFFNAIYNPAFNSSSEIRRQYIRQFREYGINVLRIWCQWDNSRGFADSNRGTTLFSADGNLKAEYLERLKGIIEDADSEGTVIELVLFARESWNEDIRLTDTASEKALKNVASELKKYRNVIFQIWNEFDYRTVDYYNVIKSVDKARIVTNSPGYGGVLGSENENKVLDYLSPHTSRDDNTHWTTAVGEINYLLLRYNKPVVDDEPARRGTSKYGGPSNEVFPFDQIIQIYEVWKAGGYVNYHHDMFQNGYGDIAVPPNGIPSPGFSKYHDTVFDFLKNKNRYLRFIR